jgi:hypothetical protein
MDERELRHLIQRVMIQNVVVIPVLWRARAAAVSTKLRNAEQSPWESDFWNHATWYREA